MNRYSTWFVIGPRGCGRTTALVTACNEINATMLCASHDHARRVAAEHGIPTHSIQGQGQGLRGPFLADHFTVETICHQYEDEISRLSSEGGIAYDLLVRWSESGACANTDLSQDTHAFLTTVSEELAPDTCPECHGTRKTVINKHVGVEDCPVCGRDDGEGQAAALSEIDR